jgi:hypothetical protein
MNYIFKKNIHSYGESIIKIDEDGTVWFVGLDDSNPDYLLYLSWIAEGNEPEVVE